MRSHKIRHQYDAGEKATLRLIVDPTTKHRLVELAEKSRRSLTGEVEFLIEQRHTLMLEAGSLRTFSNNPVTQRRNSSAADDC